MGTSDYHKQRYIAKGAEIRQQASEWRRQNPEYSKNYGRAYAQVPVKRAKILWLKARKRGGDTFALTLARVEVSLMIGVCERSGIKFEFAPHDRYKYHPFAPSLDRIDPFGPYSDQNVQVVCNAYNFGKNQMTDDEYIDFCRAVVAASDARKAGK